MSNIALRLFQGEALTEILEGDDEAIEFWTSHVEQASGTSEADSREADTSETATEAKPSSRPSAQDRKEDYLDIGMEILTRFTPAQAAAATSDALAHVLVSDVAERAGVTKGSVYHIWPSQEAFRRDLLTQILERENGIGIQQIAGLVEAGQNSDGDPATLLRAASNVAFDIMKNDPLFFARFSFYLFATNPEVSELLYRSDEQLAEQFGGAIDLYLNLRGRQLRKPFTIEMIVITGSSLLMGLTLRYRTSPEVVDGFRDADPSLPGRYATGLEAICMHFSEPKPDA